MTYTPYLVPVSAKGIVFENNTVWLRKNERNEWELPGGKIDPGEQPTDTVLREMKEELGFDVEVKDVVDAYMYTINKSTDESYGVLVLAYLCEITGKSGLFETNGEAGKAEFAAFEITEITSLNMPEFYKAAIEKASKL